MKKSLLPILAGTLACAAPDAPNGPTTGSTDLDVANLIDATIPAIPAVGKLMFKRRALGTPVNQSELWIMNANGTNLTRVTCNDRDDQGPAWSPDGQTIAFFSPQTVDGLPTQFLYLIGVTEGCGPGTLLAEGRFPDWSPDGRKLVFDRGRLGVRDIYARDLLDGTEVNLTNDPTGRSTRADWSPDGRKIAYSRGAENAGDIAVMNPDGSGPTQLTFGPADDNAPRWSPDGKRIVFQSDRDGDLEIYVMDADGSNQTRLTFRAGGDATPDWSPDGQKIVWHGDTPGSIPQLFIMNADGSDVTQLTGLPTLGMFPAWHGGVVPPE